MKRLLYILVLLVLNFTLKAQSTFPVPSTGGGLPVKQFLGSDSTLIGSKGISWPKYGDVYGIFTDTTAANLTRIKQYPFARIATSTDQITWVRNRTATKWLTASEAGGGGGGTTNVTVNNSDSTLIICFGDGTCDTLHFNNQIFNYFFLDDSTVVACDQPTVVCNAGVCVAEQNCDTVHIAGFKGTIYQNGVEERPNKIVELGNEWQNFDNPNTGYLSTWLHHSKVINTFGSQLNFTGFAVWNPLSNWFQQQNWGLSSDIIDFLHQGTTIPTVFGYHNRNRLRIGYFGNIYGETDTTIAWGYFGKNFAGYYIGTNIFAAASYGMQVDDQLAKWGGMIIRDKDTANNAIIDFIGGRPTHNSLVSPTNAPLVSDTTTMPSKLLLSLFTDKHALWYGYGSTSSFIVYDSTNYKPLVADANGNMYRSVGWLGGGGTITADNGLTMSTATNVQLGGTLLKNTTIATSTFGLSVTKTTGSATALQVNTFSSTGQALDVVGGASSSGYAMLTRGAGSIPLGVNRINATTNSNETVLQIIKTSTGATSSGVGADITVSLTNGSNSTNTMATLSFNYTNTGASTIVSTYKLNLANGNSNNDIFLFTSTGALQLNKYGVGTFTGTPAYTLQVDASGNIIEGSTSISGVWLLASGGTLTGDNNIVENSHSLSFQGSGSNIIYFDDGVIDITNNNNSIPLTVTGNTSANFMPIFINNKAATNTILEALTLRRTTTGTSSAGIGVSLKFQSEDGSGVNGDDANSIDSKLTDVTSGAITSQLIFTGKLAGTTGNLLVLSGDKSIQLTPITATAASAITPAEGMLVFVSNTNGTFTTVGIWCYQNGAWKAL